VRTELKRKFNMLTIPHGQQNNLGALIQGEYLFVRKHRHIFYMKMTGGNKVQRVDLDLDEGMEIVFIMTTGKPDLFSIIVNKREDSLTYVL
jgi:hypothetical protein